MRGAGGRRLTAAVLVAVTLLAFGCSDDKKDGSASGTDDSGLSSDVASDTTTTTAPTTTTLSADDQVLTAYQASWAALAKALDPPNADLPDLLETMTGTVLQQSKSIILQLGGLRAVGRGGVVLSPKLISRNDTEAHVEDCLVDNSHIFDAVSGERVDTSEPPSVTLHLDTRMVLEDGKWKRETSQQLGDECTPG